MKRRNGEGDDGGAAKYAATTPSTEAALGLNEVLEARTRTTKGSAVYATASLPKGYRWADHPVCVSDAGARGGRRLPSLCNLDELMEEVTSRAAAGDVACSLMLRGPWRMSHVKRHLDVQQTTAADLPDWARALDVAPAEYNLLAAMLQSNLVRHDSSLGEGDGLVLNPLIRLANHSCDGNTEIAWAPDAESGCTCGVGMYMLVATRDIHAGEEITYSYIGPHAMHSDVSERRQLLARRWGFACECALCRGQLYHVSAEI